jgi:[acyl-carrier-protein] S-malonyltransferase
MGSDIFQTSAEVRELYQRAAVVLDFDLAEVSFHGPAEALRQTRITQPALFVHSYALYQLRQPLADMMAGHSLGEFTAFTAAGAMEFEEGLRLVKRRGELMQKAGEGQPGAMAAIIGLDQGATREICLSASAAGIAVVANMNSPTQLVISGSVAGVEKAMKLAEEAGAKKAIRLQVSGAFHSPLMEPARAELARALANACMRAPKIPVYGNVTAQPCGDPDEIRALLEKQLVSPVLWTQTIEQMIKDGAGKFIEVGAGSVLTALVRRIDHSVETETINA